MKIYQIKMLFAKVVSVLKDCRAEMDMSRFDHVIDKLIPITQTENGIIIKIGKLNYVVNQHFQSEGATAKGAIEIIYYRKRTSSFNIYSE